MPKRVLLLHGNILLFSLTGIFSKLAANNIAQNGVLHFKTALFFCLMLINCGIYGFFWQQNLKHFDVNVAYAHRAVSNIWSLVWAVLIFSEPITLGNVVGTLLIMGGIWVIQSE